MDTAVIAPMMSVTTTADGESVILGEYGKRKNRQSQGEKEIHP